jgi:hypothetical protein
VEGYTLSERAQYTEAEPLYQRARAIDEQAPGLDHPTGAIGLENLAVPLRQMGQPEQACSLATRAHAIRARGSQSS